MCIRKKAQCVVCTSTEVWARRQEVPTRNMSKAYEEPYCGTHP